MTNSAPVLPDFLSHYYECARGPFRNLSDLPVDEAEAVLAALRRRGEGFAGRRQADYLSIRRGLEDDVRARFIDKGGQPLRARPHYMLLGACAWVKGWYAHGCELRIPLVRFDAATVSFTYGDIFPAMRYTDGKPYRRQIYTLAELPALVREFGLPQVWNADGANGPDRYIEAQVWDDRPLAPYFEPPP